jgi:hypothetical protein
VEFDSVTHEFGHGFPTTMMVNHFAVMFAIICDSFYQSLAFGREVNRDGADKDSIDEAYAEYEKKMYSNSIGFCEKGFEGMEDIGRLIAKVVPKWFTLIVTLLIGIFGVWKTCLRN